MHQPQCRVAILDFGYQYPHCADVINLREPNTLALHFAPDTVNVLGSPGDLEIEACTTEGTGEFFLYATDKQIPFEALAVQQARDFTIGVRVDVTKRQVFKLPLEVTDTQAMG